MSRDALVQTVLNAAALLLPAAAVPAPTSLGFFFFLCVDALGSVNS